MTHAQTVTTLYANVDKGDSTVIRLKNYTGYLQWQESSDSANWIDISDAHSDTFLFIADQTTYFRALVTVGNCEPFISEIAKIIVADSLTQGPSIPILLSPTNNETLDSYSTELSWICSEPENDSLTYNVYFDDADASTLVSENQATTVWPTGNLEYSTTYYWKVVVNDSEGNQVESETWKFTTVEDTSSVMTEFQISLKYPGVVNSGWAAVYIAWVEDENGNNIQNLYICNKIKTDMTTDPNALVGTVLPYWRREKSNSINWDDVDGITGASIQTSFDIIRTFSVQRFSKIRVCFEIDKATNGNEYFNDRPCFIYKSELIDLNTLKEYYMLNLEGYMANNTGGGNLGQNPPLQDIPGFEVWKFMSDVSYIAPHDMFVDETSDYSNFSVVIEKL